MLSMYLYEYTMAIMSKDVGKSWFPRYDKLIRIISIYYFWLLCPQNTIQKSNNSLSTYMRCPCNLSSHTKMTANARAFQMIFHSIIWRLICSGWGRHLTLPPVSCCQIYWVSCIPRMAELKRKFLMINVRIC